MSIHHYCFAVLDIKDEETEIGSIRLSVECLAALQAVEQEMTREQPSPEETE